MTRDTQRAHVIATVAEAQQQRIAQLEAALRMVDIGLTCRDGDSAHYCPNCDNSTYRLREMVRTALAHGSAT